MTPELRQEIERLMDAGNSQASIRILLRQKLLYPTIGQIAGVVHRKQVRDRNIERILNQQQAALDAEGYREELPWNPTPEAKADLAADFELARKFARTRLGLTKNPLQAITDQQHEQYIDNLARAYLAQQQEVGRLNRLCIGDGADGLCGYCGEMTQSLAGNPGLWPMYFPDPDQYGTGVGRQHHVKCLLLKIDAGIAAERERDALREALVVLNDAVYTAICESNGIGDNEWKMDDGSKVVCDFPIYSFVEAMKQLCELHTATKTALARSAKP